MNSQASSGSYPAASLRSFETEEDKEITDDYLNLCECSTSLVFFFFFQVIKMLVVIAAVYAVFTLPYHVTWLLSVFGYPNFVAKKLCVLLVMATSAAHPIIYGTLNQEFAKGFETFFRCAKETKRYKHAKEETLKLSTVLKSSGRAQAVGARGVSCKVKRKENRRIKCCHFQRENEILRHVEIVSSL